LAVPPRSEAFQAQMKLPVGSLRASGSHFCFCSSLPYQISGISARPLHKRMQSKPGSTTPISSATIWKSMFVKPGPPYSFGMKPYA
jgi:hypothetical protein